MDIWNPRNFVYIRLTLGEFPDPPDEACRAKCAGALYDNKAVTYQVAFPPVLVCWCNAEYSPVFHFLLKFWNSGFLTQACFEIFKTKHVLRLVREKKGLKEVGLIML